MSPKLRQKNIAIFERILADATAPEKIKRNATLRLSRLRAAAKRPTTSTRAAAPAPVPTDDQIFQAVQAFRSLASQRSTLIRKRKSDAEREILHTMIALMPATIPQGSDPTAWKNFVAQIDGTLTEIRSIKTL
jgi:hypothetical protein